MIGISELDVVNANLSEAADVYKINQAGSGILYSRNYGIC